MAKSSNPFWVLCCCGCIPLVGLIKGAILVGPIVAIVTICNTLSSLVLLPLDIVMSYYSVAVTQKLGPRIKVLLMLLMFIPLLIFPAIVALGSVLFGLGLGLFYPMATTIGSESYCGGIADTCEKALNSCRDFWDYNRHTFFEFLSDLRHVPCDNPFDISFGGLIVGLIVALVGTVLDGVVITLLTAVKLIPALLRGWFFICEAYCRASDATILQMMCFPFFLVALAVWPAVAAIIAAGCILYGIGGGVASAVRGYQKSLSHGIWHIWEFVVQFDRKSNEFVFGNHSSCLSLPAEPAVPARPTAPPTAVVTSPPQSGPLVGTQGRAHQPPRTDSLSSVEPTFGVATAGGAAGGAAGGVAGGAPASAAGGSGAAAGHLTTRSSTIPLPPPTAPPASMTMLNRLMGTPNDNRVDLFVIWDSFFNACGIHCQDALEREALSSEDIEDMEPFIFIGLPSLVILRALQRSIEMGTEGIMLATGIEITHETRPNVAIADRMFSTFLAAKALLQATNPSVPEFEYLESLALCAGSDRAAGLQPPPNTTEARKVELHAAVAAVESLGTKVSRLPQFRRRFAGVISRIASEFQGQPRSMV